MHINIHRSSATLISVLTLSYASASMAEPASDYVPAMRDHEQVELAPPFVRAFSNRLWIGLDNEPALNALAQARRTDRSSSLPERPTPLTLYGRVGPLNFQNELGAEQGTRFGLKRTGPALGGKVYVGIRKQW